MKKSIATFLLVFCFLSAYCQTNNKATDSTYCEVTCYYKFASTYKVSDIQIDFGTGPQNDGILSTFYTPVQIMNYMSKKGWELVSSDFKGPLYFVFKRRVVSNTDSWQSK